MNLEHGFFLILLTIVIAVLLCFFCKKKQDNFENIIELYSARDKKILDFCVNKKECRTLIIDLISQAKNTIVLSTSSIDEPFFNQQSLDYYLTLAHSKKVKINLILPSPIPTKKYKVHVPRSNCSYYCNNNMKFLTIDNQKIFIGDPSGSLGCLTTYDSRIKSYLDKLFKAKQIKPDNINEYNNFIHLIRNSKKYLYLENYYIDSDEGSQNQIIVEISKKILNAILNDLDYKVMIITNTDHENICVQHYNNILSQDLYKVIYDYCNIYNKISKATLNNHLFIGTLIGSEEPTNILIQDGENMIKTSSTISDRSLSSKPCNMEFGILFNDPPKIQVLVNKLWNQRLKDFADYNRTCTEVFDLAHSEFGQYRHINPGNEQLNSITKKLARITPATGPCNATFEFDLL